METENTQIIENKPKRKFSIPWLLYLLFFLLIYISGSVSAIKSLDISYWIDLLMSTPALIALIAYTFKKQWGNQKFWKFYSIIFIIYDIVNNMIVDPLLNGMPLSIETAAGGIIVLPLYIALVLFAFKNRTQN